MQLKTKLFTLAIIAVLAVPMMLGGNSGGRVLGVQETVDDDSKTGITGGFKNPFTSSDQPTKTRQTGSIASGITEEVTKSSEVSEYEGEIRWDQNSKVPVSSDKFGLGQGLVVSTEKGTFNLVVGDKRLLSADTLLLVDKQTFILLGGNPETEESIPVLIIKK